MAELSEIGKVIKATLEPLFERVRILDVRVRRDVDFEGDNILRIDMIVDPTPLDIDADRRIAAIRHLRPKLDEIGETAFPILSLIARSDIGKAEFEPA